MKIAIPTSDRVKLYNKTGRTTEFAICELVDGSYEFLEFRKNPHKHGDHGDREHSHKEIVDALKDCDALLVWEVGKYFKKDFDEAGIPIYKTNQEDLKEAISVFALDILSHVRL